MLYLDTSVAVPLFVPEPLSDRADAWFTECSEILVSADWLVTEFASALSIKERRAELSADQARSAWVEFRAFCETGLRLVPVSRLAYGLASDLVRDSDSGLPAGDALHLAVALEIGAAGIVTADVNLVANARRNGLTAVSF